MSAGDPSPLAARPDLIEPAALMRLRTALLNGEPNGRLLLALRRAEEWCDRATEPDAGEIATADRMLLNKALVLIRAAAMGAMGLSPGPDWEACVAAFASRPHGDAEAAAFARYQRACAIARALGPLPIATAAALPADGPIRAEMDRLHRAQVELQAHTTPGQVRADSLAALDALLADYDRLLSATPADAAVIPYIAASAAHAADALARGRALNGELARASLCYDRAARLYDSAAEPDQARTAREESARTRFAANADVDHASIPDLARLADGIADPVERARVLFRLADRAREANDGYTALTHAEKGLTALADAGFPEPAGGTFAAVTASWIDPAFALASGNAAVRLILWIGTEIMRTRALRWAVGPESAGDAAQAEFDCVGEFLRLLLAEQSSVADEIRAGLAPHGLNGDDDAPARSDGTDHATELLRRIGAATDVDEAQRLVDEARAIAMPSLTGQACLTLAQLRLDAGDPPGAIAAAQAGEAALVPTGDPIALIGLPGFDILIELRRQRMGALASTGASEAVFDCAWPTIRLLESARYRVSNPVEQAAFLQHRTSFYELAAFSAYKLGRWDDLLTAMDLFKARSALRNRLAPAPDDSARALAARFEDATRRLATAPADEHATIAGERRAIWELLTVTRLAGADAANLPDLKVATIQERLEPEEAAVSWSFVAPRILLVLAITPGDVHVERVILTDEQGTLLDQYIAAIQAGQAKSRALGRTISTLAAAVLPTATREAIAAAKRLIFSPHRQLNLLPLHAARFDDAYLIERASVRYVPNLGSLLLPWEGGGAGLIAIGIDRSHVPGYPPLAHAEEEARAVTAAWRDAGQPAACITGDAANLAAVTDLDLAGARAIHLATHGSSVLLGDARADPFASHLVLADAVLDALAISQLRLRAEVVVMSACFSGQRSLAFGAMAELPGDDLFGLQAAFLQAGARSVFGALWPLVDEAAARILPAMHAGLAAGIAPDIALQDALRRELATQPTPDVYAWGALFISSIGRASAGKEGLSHD